MKIYCFAGPNGSGKSTTVEKFMQINALTNLPFVNADNFAKKYFSDIENINERNLEAAEYADEMRNFYLQQNQDFMFETVLSDITSEHNKLNFLQQAKAQGADIITVYVLTRDSAINVARVSERVKQGGHPVPVDKIISRYDKCISALPDVINASNSAIIYDNSKNFITDLMVHKNNNNAVTFVDKPDQDKFLQSKIVTPLQEKFKLNFMFSAPPKNLNIYSCNDLHKYINNISQTNNTSTIKK